MRCCRMLLSVPYLRTAGEQGSDSEYGGERDLETGHFRNSQLLGRRQASSPALLS
jgi:hypothetical protein